MNNDFYLFARDKRISATTLDGYSRFVSSYINPTILEERKLNVAQLDIFSRLQADRIIFLGVPIDDDVANIIQAQLLYLTSINDKEDISLYLNTPGGYVSAGLGIYDTMQIIKPHVATICTGMAASMGAVLLCAGSRGKRMILPHSRVMIHQPIGGADGQATDIMIAAKEIQKTKHELASIISEHTGQTFEKVLSDSDRDYWMAADEAVAYGMVDCVMEKADK